MIPTYYPLFLDVTGRRVVVVGAGKVALRKTRRLVECGAIVTVIAPSILPAFEALPATLLRRRFRSSDVRGAFLVFAATNDREVNRRAGEAARRAGALANIADAPGECDFIVPALVVRGGLRIALSTSGADPRRAAALRKRLQAFLDAAR